MEGKFSYLFLLWVGLNSYQYCYRLIGIEPKIKCLSISQQGSYKRQIFILAIP